MQQGQIEFDTRYRREYLTTEKFHRFDEALVAFGQAKSVPGWRDSNVLELETHLEAMNARVQELESQALHAQARLAAELEELRRSFRAELAIPYRGGELVRAADIRSPFRAAERRRNGS